MRRRASAGLRHPVRGRRSGPHDIGGAGAAVPSSLTTRESRAKLVGDLRKIRLKPAVVKSDRGRVGGRLRRLCYREVALEQRAGEDRTLSDSSHGTVTQFLREWSDGDQEALVELIPLVYDELRSLASAYLRRERPDHTLQTSALVHEAYLRLLEQQRVRWHNRTHFFGIAAQAMRRILVDHARSQLYAKRGGGAPKLSLDEALTLSAERAPELVALDDALIGLAAVDPQLARIVDLRFFAGLTHAEISHVLGISLTAVTRGWRAARAWLYRTLTEGDPDGA